MRTPAHRPVLGPQLRRVFVAALGVAGLVGNPISAQPRQQVAGEASGATVQDAEDDTQDYGELDTLTKYEDAADRDAHVTAPPFLEDYFAAKRRLREEAGFNYIVEYSPISQWGAGEFHADHELNLIGLVNVVGSPGSAKGNVLAWFQHSYTLGGLTTGDFMAQLGMLSPPNGGDTSPGRSANRLQHLAWEQLLAHERVQLMIGKLTSRVTIDQNRYAVSDREDFYSPMIVNNPVVPFTARGGLGLFARYDGGGWYASTLIRDADAAGNWIDFDSLSTGNWEYAFEGAWTPELGVLGAGNYRATYHYTDAIGSGDTAQGAGWSISLSFDQDLGRRFGAYFRYAYADTPLRVFHRRLAAGAQWLEAFGYDDDRVGLGFWWGEATDPELASEYGLELFWRVQLLRVLELTPDLQIVVDPALDPSRAAVVIGGLRLRAVL